MKKLLIGFIFIFALCMPVKAQNNFFPTHKGDQLLYKHYDARGREMKYKNRPMWTRFTVDEVWIADDGDITANVEILNEYTSRLNREVEKHAVEYIDNMVYGDVKLVGDSVILDNMNGLLLKALGSIPAKGVYAGHTVNMSAVCTYPRDLHVGMELPDIEVMHAETAPQISSQQVEKIQETMAQFAMEQGEKPITGGVVKAVPTVYKATMKNRRVEAVDNVDTPAGTFECYKITYELVEEVTSLNAGTGSGMKSSIYTEWISPKIGLIKKVEYTSKNKLIETMILESIKITE